jgi:small subunit ribosomal protein S17
VSPVARTPQESVAGRKVRQGVVVSAARDKTITVLLESSRSHPVYGKTVRRSSKLHAHDERNEAGEGDLVRIVECRPLSRQKRWRLTDIVEKAL